MTSSTKNDDKVQQIPSDKKNVSEELCKFLTPHTQGPTIENNLVIWYNDTIDFNDEKIRNSIARLKCFFDGIHVFNHRDYAVDFLTDTDADRIFMVISSDASEQIVPLIDSIEQLDRIFVFCNDIESNESWAKHSNQVKGIFNDIELLCDSLIQNLRQDDQDLISASTFAPLDSSNSNLNELDPSFMYSQLLKEILLRIKEDDDYAKQEFVKFCRDQNGAQYRTKQIEDFEQNYQFFRAIFYYTKESFVYSVLNRALRTQQTNVLMKMGFFIRDLYEQIEYGHDQTRQTHETITVYRGQGMSKSDFEKLRQNSGGLLSFNSFLSTSLNSDIARIFAYSAKDVRHQIGIVFQMNIDCKVHSVPYTSTKIDGCFGNAEEEILFSMHTIFRIGDMQEVEDRLWEVQLNLTDENDSELLQLTNCVRNEIGRGDEWGRLGNLYMRMGEFERAEEMYKISLNATSNNDYKSVATRLHQLGSANAQHGKYETALSFYQRSLDIEEKYPTFDWLRITLTYNDMSIVYESIADYENALTFSKKSLEIAEQHLSTDDATMATVLNNMAGIYREIEDYSTALSLYEKGHRRSEISLPPNHPQLAVGLSNIGLIYSDWRDYPTALSYQQKALRICKFLPSNHPDVAAVYSNLGAVHQSIQDYSAALSFYQKALQINQKCFPSDSPELVVSYNNIGSVLQNMADYSGALSYYQKALDIRQKAFGVDHYLLANIYNNIGTVNENLECYSSALSFYQKSLAIKEKNLPYTYLKASRMYFAIGRIYQIMKDHLTATSFFEKSIDILNKFSQNNLGLIEIYNSIGETYRTTEDYLNALFFYNKALDMHRNTSASDTLLLSYIHNNIGLTHLTMGNNEAALNCLQIALEIKEKLSSRNDCHLSNTYSNIATVYQELKDFPNALLFYEKALKIDQISLLPNHPYLANNYYNIGKVYSAIGDNHHAIVYYKKALEIKTKNLSPDHAKLGEIYNNIAVACDLINKPKEALLFFQKELEIKQKHLSPDSLNLALIYSNVVSCYHALGEYDSVMDLLEMSLEIRLKTLSPIDKTFAIICNNMAIACEKLRNYPRAIEYSEKAVNMSTQVLGATHSLTREFRSNLTRIQNRI